MAELHKVAAKTVNEDTDLEKIKLLFNRTVPTVEKLVREMEKYLRDYSGFADPDDLNDMSERVEAASQEAARFTELVGELYDENKGYAPGLSGHKKATADIKPFTAGSDVTILEFLEKFSAYCAKAKKIKA